MYEIPQHIAIIMDGNGRWAKQKGAMRLFGHKNAIQAVRDSVEFAAENGVKYLTLYAFSTENWNRPKYEVDGLMSLLIDTINGELPTLHKNNIRLESIGDTLTLPTDVQKKLNEAIDNTKLNTGLTLVLALNYSGRWDIEQALKKMLEKKFSAKNVDSLTISQYLATHNYPDPELLIRTSGEMRISNFMLWQLAYTELVFLEVLWPDFRKEHFRMALEEYNKRERRFGKTSEQILTE